MRVGLIVVLCVDGWVGFVGLALGIWVGLGGLVMVC